MMRNRSYSKGCFISGMVALLLCACVGEDSVSEGSLAIDVTGGAALYEGFPCSMHGVPFAFADGWEIQFDKYVRSVGEVSLQEQGSGEEVGSWIGPRVMDLAATATASDALTTIEGLPARRFDIGFSLVAPSALPDTSNISAEDVQLMIDNGWSIYFSGEAHHPTTSRRVRFDVGFPVAARYYDCNNGKDSTRGVAIEANKTTGVFIYPCVEHLFFDTLASGDEHLRFEAWAAVAGDDGVVTEADLRLQDLTDLRDASGQPLLDEHGNRVVYNDGGLLPPDEWTLYHHVKHAARDGAHFNGLGLCKVENLAQ